VADTRKRGRAQPKRAKSTKPIRCETCNKPLKKTAAAALYPAVNVDTGIGACSEDCHHQFLGKQDRETTSAQGLLGALPWFARKYGPPVSSLNDPLFEQLAGMRIEDCRWLHERTQNPLFAWDALFWSRGISWSRGARQETPEWILAYLAQAAVELLAWTDPAAQQKPRDVQRAMGLLPPAGSDMRTTVHQYQTINDQIARARHLHRLLNANVDVHQGVKFVELSEEVAKATRVSASTVRRDYERWNAHLPSLP
jgi:hypothetical protein